MMPKGRRDQLYTVKNQCQTKLMDKRKDIC